ncbi:hypothetical protein BH20VER2_BH20VER2_08240 [soil metagenome]
MNILKNAEAQLCSPSAGGGARRFRWKPFALAFLVGTLGFVVTGCNDPYYGRGRVHTGVYATYGTPGHYYRHDPYGYGYRRGYVTPRYRTTRGYYGARSGYRTGGYGVRRGGYYGARSGYRTRGYAVRRGGSQYRRTGRQVRRSEVRRGRGAASQRRAQARRARVQEQTN